MNPFYDAFVSYGRVDSKVFALRLNERLASADLKIWIDFNDIPLGVDFQQQIDQGIQISDNFIFIIAPHAVNSPYCRIEIERALQYNKRIIPLLHVPAISRETWQQRYPQGSDRDWADFQSQGLHSSSINLHPAIRRINWINFREGIDDFETSVQGLLELCRREADYVHRHTLLLTQAVAWQQQQKQPQHLLIGEEREQAEAWLKRRFQGEQPPCMPTDLHCEFITESIKNANNLMTQVFLAYAEVDAAIATTIRLALLRQGITVWSSQQDIALGSDFQQAIDNGIEAADNLLYLLSPSSLQSTYCQQELAYALALNKRVIPMLIVPVAAEQMPPALATLQYIDLSEVAADLDLPQAQFQTKIGDLLRILQQDDAYYSQHKVLLVKALKWERQHRNPAMLLRGSSLQQAENWLKLAHPRSQHQPTPLQADFVTESLRLPPASSLDVFISYSRTDSDFARRLNEALQVQGKTTWFDQESIPPGADFQREIFQGIEQSNHFLFVLSPSAVESPYCATEVEYAQQLNKRVVTVLHRPIDPAALHPILSAVQWIDFSQGPRNFSSRFEQLIRTLNTDVDHLRTHTRLLVRAIEWQTSQRRDSLLLRGDDLEAAEDWLTKGLEKQPRPTPLQGEYLKASRVAEDAHQKEVIATLTQAQEQAQQRLRLGAVGMAVLLLLGALLGLMTQQAVKAARESRKIAQQAIEEVTVVEEQLVTTRRRAVTRIRQVREQLTVATTEAAAAKEELSKTIIQLTEIEKAIAGKEFVVEDNARLSFDSTLALPRSSGEQPGPQRPTDEGSLGFAPSPPNTGIGGDGPATPAATPTAAPTASQGSYLYDLSGQLLVSLAESSPRFSPNGDYIVATATAGEQRGTVLYTAAGERLAAIVGLAPRFSPNSQWVVTSADDQSTLYNISTQTRINLRGLYPVFSPSGDRLITYQANGDSYLYDLAGNLLAQFPGAYPKFSANGQWLLTSRGDSSYLHSVTSGESMELEGHSPSFSPNQRQVVVTAVGDRSSYLYDLDSQQRRSLEGGYPSFSADGTYLITQQATPQGKISYLYSQAGALIAQFSGNFRALSPDRRTLLSTGEGQSFLYSLQGERLATYGGGFGLFSPDGRLVITAAADDRSNLYALNGEAIAQIQGQNPTFSPRGEYIVTYSRSGQSFLYDLTGQPLAQFEGQFPRFSPQGSELVTDTPLP